MENHRDIIRVEKKALQMKIKYLDKIMDNYFKANYSALSHLSAEQSNIIRSTIMHFKKLRALDATDICKNHKFKVMIQDPNLDFDNEKEVEISFDHLDEIFNESMLSKSEHPPSEIIVNMVFNSSLVS